MIKKVGSVFLIIVVVAGVSWYWHTYNTPAYAKKWGWFPTTTFIPLWERKVQTQQVLKIGMITDTHVHPNRIDRTNKADDAPRYLGSVKDAHPLKLFVQQMAQFQPTLIIHEGDVIEGTDDPAIVGQMGLDLVQAELEKIGVPVYWIVGNHDLRSVDKRQFTETLDFTQRIARMQAKGVDQVIDQGDYRLILLDANYYPDGREVVPGGKRHIPGYLHPATLAWLERQLDTDKRVYVFMHQGAFFDPVRQGETADVDAMIARTKDPKIRKKLLRQKNRNKAPITNAAAFRALLEKYNVDAFINGHLEVARYDEIGGVRYYSLTGTKKSDVFPESFYEMTLDAGVPHIQMYYTDPADRVRHSVPFAETFRAR